MKRPYGFYHAVREHLGVDVSKGMISMVKSGRRTNDAILLAIIHVDHNWKQLEHDRIKKLL